MGKTRRAATTATHTCTDNAKVQNKKDIEKVLDYFRHTIGTTLDAMLAIGILRNFITYYVLDLEYLGLSQAVLKKRYVNTNGIAKKYPTNLENWKSKFNAQLSLI